MATPITDLTGQKFNRLTVLGLDTDRTIKGRIYWNCLCECGAEKSIRSDSLKGGAVISCGCYNVEINSGIEDLSGLKFGRLTVLNFNRREKYQGKYCYYWSCQCECGGDSVVRSHLLKSGDTQSCGCINKEIVAALGKQNATHGMSKSSTYNIWVNMKQRCINPNNHAYMDYGGRDISVCSRWLESFENFLEDMGERPKGMTIDRIDNNKNYSPDNCKWVSYKKQNNNKRSNKLITYNERTQTIAQWSDELGISTKTLWARLNKSNWSIERAFTTPLQTRSVA